MVKLDWRKSVCFLIVLACATGALVAAGLSEGARLQQPGDALGTAGIGHDSTTLSP